MKTRLEFDKIHVKRPEYYWNNIIWTNEFKIKLIQNDRKRRIWRRQGTSHHPKHTISSEKHGGGSGEVNHLT